MSAFPDLIHRPDTQRLKGLVIKLPAVIVPHTPILPDHKIKVRLLLNSLVSRAIRFLPQSRRPIGPIPNGSVGKILVSRDIPAPDAFFTADARSARKA
jgi:hypothetical protein